MLMMKPHTVMYYTTHICIRQSTLSRWMDHDVSKPKLFSGFFFFFKFVTFSQSNFCFSKICGCYLGGGGLFFGVFPFWINQLLSFPLKWTSETSLPEGIHLFSHGDSNGHPENTNALHTNSRNKKGFVCKVRTEKYTEVTSIIWSSY